MMFARRVRTFVYHNNKYITFERWNFIFRYTYYRLLVSAKSQYWRIEYNNMAVRLKSCRTVSFQMWINHAENK